MPALTDGPGVTIRVKPDLSAFREATVSDIIYAIGCDRATAEQFLEHYWAIPR
jgi:hypothetical protein